jgi:DNA-cytosine methyltransferase
MNSPLIIDSFAGGGGASTGIELAFGRSPDIAINHDEAALSMHEANHPETLHFKTNVWKVNPREVCGDRQVALAWFSPDCKHHSKAKGGKPLKRNIRDLAWVVVYWAKMVRPEVILLENVEEFQDWGPLTEQMKPCAARRGQTFNFWVEKLRRLGYKVDWRQLRACDYGAPTIRKRLFLVARRDGLPIVWPEPTHAEPDDMRVHAGELQPWRTAADIIDWSLPCPSIFDTKEEIWDKYRLRAVRPLAENTERRVARGTLKYVINAKEPFFVTYGQHGGAVRSGNAPLHTITASRKDQNAIIAPVLVQTGYGEAPGQKPRALDIKKPLGTVVAGGSKHALVAAFIAQHNTGVVGRKAHAPLSTLTTRGTQQNIVAASMISMHGTSRRSSEVTQPVQTITAGGGHAGLVYAFLQKYYGQGTGQNLSDPIHTISTRDTFGLVTVEVEGQTHVITDIGMRMLTPREQFRAQGFPDSYIIDRGADGRQMTATEQVRMCGNSVCPPLAAALAKANTPASMTKSHPKEAANQ